MTNKIRLGVNIDHIAFIKKSRGTKYPDLIEAVEVCEKEGVDLITIHLREDRRHIQNQDVIDIRNNAKFLNLEMAHTDEMIDIALNVKPNFCCIVPEKREELTTEGGLDLLGMNAVSLKKLQNTISVFKKNDIKTSLFIDPDEKQIQMAKDLDATLIEIHTGAYANSCSTDESMLLLDRLKKACDFAIKKDFLVNAGHGLNYENVKPVCKLPFNELNIGHAIIAKSVFVGLKDAIRQMISIMRSCD